jgi:uncharacterized protein YqgC (DUF456 family)
MNQLLLAAVMFLGLLMIPFGLPGTWIIAAAALGYQILVPDSISMLTIAVVFGLAVIGEVLEFTLSAKYTRKYGGSRRASWGAIIGGMIGAFVGVPVPLVGPVLGAFAGAFIGAFLGEYSRGGEQGTAPRVATGALIGRAVAAAMKVAICVGMAALTLFAAMV